MSRFRIKRISFLRLQRRHLRGSARRRRPHANHLPGRRMLAFGVNRMRYLWGIPLVLLAIAIAALVQRTPYAVNRFRPGHQVQVNPLMGWAVDATTPPGTSPIPHSLVYATLSWRTLEPEEGVYAFETFEQEHHLHAWWAMGKQLVLRFVMDVPGQTDHIDIPDYLYEAMGDEAGIAYENRLGKGFSPNYQHPLLMEKHARALAALAERYDHHSGVAFIEMGSLGHNGTWQVQGVPSEWAMPPADQLMDWAWHYASAFSDTPILMSAPWQPARVMGLGLYNDHLGDTDRTWDWLDVIAYGGYDDQVGCELRAMPNALTQAPSGARIDRHVDQQALFGDDFRAFLRQLTASRTTYVSGVDLKAVPGNEAALSAARAMMGYQLWVREARYPKCIRRDYRLKLDLDLHNDGGQAFSQPWPVELSLLREGAVVYRQLTSYDIRQALPGSQRVVLTLDIPRTLQGEYQLGLAILNPDSQLPAVALRMDVPTVGLRHLLGTVQVL